jgi:pyruvate kinase
LVDDGKLAFRVDYVDLDCIKTTALISGTISNNKGVNLPSTHLPIDILTSKDINDLNFVLSENVDYIALSFVQSADDIIQARKRIQNQVKIIAKLEKPQAIQNLSAILKETDGVMIARGDLGVELPPELVPPLQRRILREAQIYKKPVIVATQMLESMISAPKPTRAEASDVATAVYLGTDAVMLSAESASGQYPKEAVEIMDRIIFHAEQDLFLLQKEHTVTNAHTLPEAAALLACQNKAKAIVALSNSLEALISISSLKPETPILAVTSDLKIYHQLPLLYGIHAVYSSELPNTEHPIEYKRFAQKIAVQEGFITRNNHQIILLMSNTLEDVNFSGILLIS